MEEAPPVWFVERQVALEVCLNVRMFSFGTFSFIGPLLFTPSQASLPPSVPNCLSKFL